MSMAVRPFWRIDSPLPQTHGRQAVQVRPLRTQFLPLRPSGTPPQTPPMKTKCTFFSSNDDDLFLAYVISPLCKTKKISETFTPFPVRFNHFVVSILILFEFFPNPAVAHRTIRDGGTTKTKTTPTTQRKQPSGQNGAISCGNDCYFRFLASFHKSKQNTTQRRRR